MTSNILTKYMSRYNSAEQTLAAYAYGGAANHVKDDIGLGEMLAIPAGLYAAGQTFKGGKWVYQNKGNLSQAYKSVKEANNAKAAAAKGGNLWQTSKNMIHQSKVAELSAKYKRSILTNGKIEELSSSGKIKYQSGLEKSKFYSETRKLLNEAKGLKGKELAAKLKQIEHAVAKGNLGLHKAMASGQITMTKAGKALAGVKKYTGFRTLSGIYKTGAASSGKLGKFIRGGKGGAAFAAVSLAFETPDLIETYKRFGAGKGTKQLGKTLLTVGAEVGGYMLAAKGGAMLGAAIGSVFPGVGNVIGGALGFVCGLAGSWLAGKLARKVMGKTELQKADEIEQRNILTAAKSGDIKAREALLMAAGEKLETADESDAEAQKALKAYEELLAQITPESEEETPEESSFAGSNDYASNKGLEALMNYEPPKESYSTGFNPYKLNPGEALIA